MINPILIADLRRQLTDLTGGGTLVGIKTGTEAEDMSFEEIHFLRQVTDGILPLYVKIGGPEARNDIRELERLHVDGLVAPMVESEYALRKFIQATDEIIPVEKSPSILRALNLETWQGYQNLDSILSSPAISSVGRITAARSDLSESMNLDPDHPDVLKTCRDIILRVREKGIESSLGGSVHPGNIESIIETIQPDMVNTRNMLMNVEGLKEDPVVLLREFLEFEINLYKNLSHLPLERSDMHHRRIDIIENRLNES